LISTSFGLWMGVDGGEQVELSDPERFRYLNLQFRVDVLVGATSLVMTQHVGVLRGVIQGEIPATTWCLEFATHDLSEVDAFMK